MVTSGQDYLARVSAESRKWGGHLQVEAEGQWNAWIDHPLIRAHYRERALVDGLPWEEWVIRHLGRAARRSLDLGCGSGGRSMVVHAAGATEFVEGTDVSEDRIAEGERIREARGVPGRFEVADVNGCELPKNVYDLIFSAHSFHHFLELEHVMEQVHEALTPDGVFILEEFVGPTQFQWTDAQIGIVKGLLSMMPEDVRTLRWGAVKQMEGRPTVEEVVAASPFESIRSAEIEPLFHKYFDVITIINLGGTLQHLLYNGIAHNFSPDHPDHVRLMRGVWEVEDALIDSGALPSDFMILVGKRRKDERRAEEEVDPLASELRELRAENEVLRKQLEAIWNSKLWRVGSLYWRIRSGLKRTPEK